MSAKTKCPSGARGWVVRTSEGSLLTTSKVFPATTDMEKLEIKCTGDPIQLGEPSHRVREKTSLRMLDADAYVGDCPPEPNCQADTLARELLRNREFTPQALAKVTMAAAVDVPSSDRDKERAGPAGKCPTSGWFTTSGYSDFGAVCVNSNARKHPWSLGF